MVKADTVAAMLVGELDELDAVGSLVVAGVLAAVESALALVPKAEFAKFEEFKRLDRIAA